MAHRLVGLGRFELPTLPLSGRCYNEQSYRPDRLTLSLNLQPTCVINYPSADKELPIGVVGL